ncbi:unnamed protein product [Caenorhabditis brenneri]
MVHFTKKFSDEQAMILETNVEVKQSIKLPKRLEELLHHRKRNKVCAYLCLGFLLSIIFAVIALGLTELLFFTLGKLDPSIPSVPCNRRIVGYYDLSSEIDLSDKQFPLLTHVIFSPVDIQSNGTLSIGEENERKLVILVVKAKKFGLKTMFTTGDLKWNDHRISPVVADEYKRKTLIQSITAFVQKYKLDGVDVQWKFMRFKGDFAKLANLCEDVRKSLDEATQSSNSPRFVMSIRSGSTMLEHIRYDEISRSVDFWNVETHSFYAHWHGNTGHLIGSQSALYSGERNVNNTMKEYTCQTKNPQSLNMEIGFFGRYWNNVKKSKNSDETLWMTAEKVNGEVQGGFIPWRDFPHTEWNISTASWDDDAKTPYIWNPDKRSYLSFENGKSVEEKMKYALDRNIGGITIFHLNLDDDQITLSKMIRNSKFCSAEMSNVVNYSC